MDGVRCWILRFLVGRLVFIGQAREHLVDCEPSESRVAVTML